MLPCSAARRILTRFIVRLPNSTAGNSIRQDAPAVNTIGNAFHPSRQAISHIYATRNMDMTDLPSNYSLFSTFLLLADLFIRISLSIRVIMRKRPYGITLAWLVVILLIPLFGGFTYLLFGENRIPERRTERAKASYHFYQQWLKTLRRRAPVSWSNPNAQFIPLHRQAEVVSGLPAMDGNRLTLIANPQAIIDAIIAAIDNAKSSCHLQFYIWQHGGKINDVAAALIRAAGRGVSCRLLLDSIGSRTFLKSDMVNTLRDAGILIREAMPANLIKLLFSRIDIRNHKKIVIIDGEIAFTGSQNMVDPAIFKVEAGVGTWVDTMVKVEGPVVESLAGTFLSDWFLESDKAQAQPIQQQEDFSSIQEIGEIKPVSPIGESAVQLVPSGPGFVPANIHSLLLTTIYAARKELILTTPYFIPDEPLLDGLKAAAQRGVTVKIIMPEKNDSRLVHYASRAHFDDLLRSGVELYLFRHGLLHAKTITVDRNFALFGSVNLDMRSFWLNFEATLFIYCRNFTAQLLALQLEYLQLSIPVDAKRFALRSKFEKFKENITLLVSPLL
jgi:cardiolipin synthase